MVIHRMRILNSLLVVYCLLIRTKRKTLAMRFYSLMNHTMMLMIMVLIHILLQS